MPKGEHPHKISKYIAERSREREREREREYWIHKRGKRSIMVLWRKL